MRKIWISENILITVTLCVIGFSFLLLPQTGAENSLLKVLRNRASSSEKDNGTALVFASDRSGEWQIWTSALDGSNPRQITSDPGDKADPALSPDGETVAFVHKESGRWELWITGITEKNPHKLTALNGFIRSPAWQPDGSRIAYSFSREEEPFFPNAIMEVLISNRQVKTLIESRTTGETGITWFLNYPVFSTDATSLFHTRAEISTPGFPKYTAVSIVKTDLYSGTSTDIVGGSFYYDEGGTIHGHWATTPDLYGTEPLLVFTAIVGYTEGSICLSSLDGKQVRRLKSDESIMYRNPAGSVERRFIFYEKATGEAIQIIRYDVINEDVIQITNQGNNRTPDL